eukprot:227036-Pyramimonas_sp.AAC.1
MEGEWFCHRTRRFRHSGRDGPSHHPLLQICRRIADAADQVLDATKVFATPLRSPQGKLTYPPFTQDHIVGLRYLGRLPTAYELADVQRGFRFQLPNVRNFYLGWFGFFWAASMLFLRAATYVIQQSTGQDS